MANSSRHAVFLDTSIQIARRVREPAMRDRIVRWLGRYSLTVSSGIVLQEFKNRVLRDIAYILTKLHQTNSYMETLNYITNVLPRGQQRKIRICVPVLQNLLPGATDAELTERATRYCRTLLVYGEAQFTRELDALLSNIECYWSKVPIREKRRYVSYDLGGRRCDATSRLCRVGTTLKAKEDLCRRLSAFLTDLPDARLTDELRRAREALKRMIDADFQDLHHDNLCLTVGDLLIALESDGIPAMYSMNYRESQAFCDFLGQTLAIRPNNPASDDVEYSVAKKPWPNP